MYDFVSNFGNFVVLVEFGVSVKKSLKTKILKNKTYVYKTYKDDFQKKKMISEVTLKMLMFAIMGRSEAYMLNSI